MHQLHHAQLLTLSLSNFNCNVLNNVFVPLNICKFMFLQEFCHFCGLPPLCFLAPLQSLSRQVHLRLCFAEYVNTRVSHTEEPQMDADILLYCYIIYIAILLYCRVCKHKSQSYRGSRQVIRVLWFLFFTICQIRS